MFNKPLTHFWIYAMYGRGRAMVVAPLAQVEANAASWKAGLQLFYEAAQAEAKYDIQFDITTEKYDGILINYQALRDRAHREYDIFKVTGQVAKG